MSEAPWLFSLLRDSCPVPQPAEQRLHAFGTPGNARTPRLSLNPFGNAVWIAAFGRDGVTISVASDTDMSDTRSTDGQKRRQSAGVPIAAETSGPIPTFAHHS